MPSLTSASRVKELARSVGFDLVRISSAGPLVAERARFQRWIENGRHGEMSWITPERAERASDPGRTLAGARSVISVALSYWSGPRLSGEANNGMIARYAWGRDYHVVLGERLVSLADRLSDTFGGAHRWYVDTGPAMEKAFAARSGLGWYGKNTNILTESLGSFVLLGEIFTTLHLDPDPVLDRDCGACRLCVRACPTGALGPDYSIDSRKCISYLTIEHRGPIPRELRPAVGGWVFGCDICQDVCPPSVRPYLAGRAEHRAWAADARSYVLGRGSASGAPYGTRLAGADNPLFHGGSRAGVNLLWLLALSHDEYVKAFRGTAIKRARVWMLRRNAAVALGNVGTPECLEGLIAAMTSDEHSLVRGHAAWALGALRARYPGTDTVSSLEEALCTEADDSVREEIELALATAATLSG